MSTSCIDTVTVSLSVDSQLSVKLLVSIHFQPPEGSEKLVSLTSWNKPNHKKLTPLIRLIL